MLNAGNDDVDVHNVTMDVGDDDVGVHDIVTNVGNDHTCNYRTFGLELDS